MIEWLSLSRIAAALGLKGKQRVRKWAGDKHQLMVETAEPVSEAKEFIRQASPIEASVGRNSWEIQERMADLDWKWKHVVRAPLIKAVDKHPSDAVQKLGNELAEDVEKLLMGLRYSANPMTDPGEKATASKSVQERHEHALKLADELLKKVRDS